MTKKSAQIAFDDVLRQVTEGNEEAFQQLYLHYHDRLFQFARMYLHQQQAAEDVVADLFFQLWKSRGMLGGIENFNAYIYRAVRNSCTNYLLSGYRNRMSGFTQVQLQVSIDPAVPADEAVDFQLLNSALTDAVEQLPERCRIIFKLAKEDGTSDFPVTGTSDALNTEYILDMMLAQDPGVSKVGLLYSLSEPNSTKPIAEAKAYLEQHGITCVEQTANTNDEVVAAAAALISAKVDAVFTPTDNVIMAAELAIADDLAEAGIPHYTGADSFVRNGAFATCGVNYTELGARTATLAYQAMTQGIDGMEDYYRMDGGIITVNTDTAAVLKADYSVFAQMAQLVEVTTTKD